MALIIDTPAAREAVAGRLAPGPGTQGGDSWGDPWLTPDHFGQAVHEVITDLAAVSQRRRQSEIVAAVTRALVRRSTASPALRRRLTALATTYVDRFMPLGTVRLLGAEVEAIGARFDLIWTTGSYHWADEIKSAGDRLTERLAQQCQRQLDAGEECWGATFVGVRVVWLQTPGRELLIARSATVLR